MPKHSDSRKQNSQYDKIIKENLEITLPVIIKDILGLDILISEELPDDIQHTKERKPDALKKVTDIAGNIFVLQIEFQVEDEKEMIYRMAEYYIMLARKYQLPIKQYVIFLKDIKPVMLTFLDTEHLKFNFALIRIAEINYKLFLRSNNPEVKMLAILADFDEDNSYQAIKSIIENIQSVTKNDFSSIINFKHLRIFVQLRDPLGEQFEKAMESVSTFFREEKDYLYRKGEARGEAKGQARAEAKGKAIGEADGEAKKSYIVVENLIKKFGWTDEQAADVAEVDIDFVKKVRSELIVR